MGFWERLWGSAMASDAAFAMPVANPRAAVSGGSMMITTPQGLDEALRYGTESGSGQSVTPDSAMRVAAVFACVRLISGAVGNMPVRVLRRVDDRTRADASDHGLWNMFNRRPNRWQKPAQFKRMMTAHVLLRGNAYALITRGLRGRVIALTPLHPDRMRVDQLDDMSLAYSYTRKDGQVIVFPQEEILHLAGFSFDGVKGVSVVGLARETIGLSMAMESHGATVFRNGANVTGALKMPAGRQLSPEQAEHLRAQMDEYRSGGSREGKVIVLEDGLDWQQMALNAEDAQWLDARKFSRGDIAMFFGVPPHMIGDTDKATSWGSGLDSQGQNFVTYTLEDYLTMWEEALNVDCIDPATDPQVFTRFNRNALVRGDIKTRWDSYVRAMQWGVMSPNEVRELEDENPREGGDIYYPPPNMAATPTEGNANVAP